MTEQEMHDALRRLSKTLRVAFLVGCVEHVREKCTHSDLADRAIELAWESVVGGTLDEARVRELTTELDKGIDEDSPTELIHLMSAIELILLIDQSTPQAIAQILNNLEAVVDTLDPDSEQGVVEERQWQIGALDFICAQDESSVKRDIFDTLQGKSMRWHQRLEE